MYTFKIVLYTDKLDIGIPFSIYFIFHIKKYYYSSIFATFTFQFIPSNNIVALGQLFSFLLPAVAYSQHLLCSHLL